MAHSQLDPAEHRKMEDSGWTMFHSGFIFHVINKEHERYMISVFNIVVIWYKQKCTRPTAAAFAFHFGHNRSCHMLNDRREC